MRPKVDFFNQINLLYGSITEFCTQETCTCMSAGPQYEYHWVRNACASCSWLAPRLVAFANRGLKEHSDMLAIMLDWHPL